MITIRTIYELLWQSERTDKLDLARGTSRNKQQVLTVAELSHESLRSQVIVFNASYLLKYIAHHKLTASFVL